MPVKNRNTVFVVDDDQAYLDMIGHHLTKNTNCLVKKFTNGKDCIKKLDLKPAIIVIDYHLDTAEKGPDKGNTLLKQIKKNSPASYNIILSKDDRLDVVADCIKEGANDFLVKNKSTFSEVESIVKHVSSAMDLKAEEKGKKNILPWQWFK